MSGSAELGDNLVDDLLETVDDLRGDLHPAFGVRQYNLTVVTRTWSGGAVGDGDYTDTELLIEPQPYISSYQTQYALGKLMVEWMGRPMGIDDSGTLYVSEISLTYTQAELMGMGDGVALGSNQEVFYKVTDALGNGIAPTYWVARANPFPDRQITIGWAMELRRAGVTP
jgi:hypothetical protein